MSIRLRLNLLMVTLLALALVSVLGAVVMSAGPRIRAENDSMMRLSKEFVETAIASLQGTPDPQARLSELLNTLKNLRHVRIFRVYTSKPPSSVDTEDPPSRDVLARLAGPEPRLVIPVFVNGQSFGAVVVAPRSSDESAEIWESITQFSVVGSLLGIATLLFMSLAVARLLEGYEPAEVATFLEVAPSSVRRWWQAFEKDGWSGLAATPVSGRPPGGPSSATIRPCAVTEISSPASIRRMYPLRLSFNSRIPARTLEI